MPNIVLFLLAAAPTATDARAFVDRANRELRAAIIDNTRIGFVNQTYINDDTEILSAQAEAHLLEVQSRLIAEAVKYKDVPNAPADVKRAIRLMSVSNEVPPPSDQKAREELATLSSELQGMFGKGKACVTVSKKDGSKTECLGQDGAEKLMASSRDEAQLRQLWVEWHKIGAPMRDKFTREVALENQGAKALGFNDVGEVWRSGYDMDPAAFSADMDRLWAQLKPFYEQLHCYVRTKLSQKYGKDKVPLHGAMPAHVLGNLWAQEWNNVYPLVEPYPLQKMLDVTSALVANKYDSHKMVKQAESFFVSLGFDPLPPSFWSRSMFTRPRDREVICHASAWDFFDGEVRVKMCLQPTEEDLAVAHHELGHDFYFEQYRKQPTLFAAGANDGFHEAVGDTITLSMTPDYFKRIGLFATTPVKNEQAQINELMQSALAKVSFLPFGLLIDRWRWEVFSGAVGKDRYNQRWWELSHQYQGIDPPLARSEADFDPGAKYHVAASTPYMRYFIARVLQFQLHRGLCKAAGFTGPLSECSIYGNQVAGEKLRAMLALGASKPWPEALAAATGESSLDATAILDYYQPLTEWLKKQNASQTCGW